jgi:pyruvate/2-oxoglutarate dehydrogenase complex dihydrolipoamide acyltransferase (E2) component
MARQRGHKLVPFTVNRRMVAAAASVNRERNTIHCLTEVDVSEARRLIREYQERTGESLSLTAYVVTCLARALSEHPALNSFRRGRRLVLLADVTISTLVERDIGGEKVPEPVGVRAAQSKTYRQIHEEIRAAQKVSSDRLGGLSGIGWVARFVPGFLFRSFIRLASRSVAMMERFGTAGVTAVGMFGAGASWYVPLSGATVAVTVGGIVGRPVVRDGRLDSAEHLCLTVSFDHDIVDGAPAARFMKRYTEILASGDAAREALEGAAPRPAGASPAPR